MTTHPNDTRPSSGKSKSLATWLAVLAGTLGVHRFYLHGLRDWIGWLHPVPTIVGAVGVSRMINLGQDDKLAWVLLPIFGFMVAAAMLQAIVMGLTSDERWNTRWNAGVVPSPNTRWLPVIGAVVALFFGAIALMSSIAFSGQKFFEWQIEEGRKISQ
jgi:hypothetical protein